MGGKQKQAQRTKGNARPSNSSRSAERLQASSTGAALWNGFAGFANIQAQSDALKAPGSAADVDPLIDGGCRMLMKRMTKKDAITRLKALQEFQNLCKTCSEDSLLGALPVWPRLFNKLCLDVDRKVREATHRANNQMVLRVKRNLAPHIKSMMGNWLLGLCDPYAPAATAAKSAFGSAFSSEKQAEAIVYCKENIFTTIADYLFQQTPQTLAESEAVPADLMEETYNRVLASSLLALGCVLDLVSPNEHQKLTENCEKIVSEGKFWKFPKSQEAEVRSAWYSSVARICGKIPAVLEPHLAKLCPAVLGKLDECEPLVIAAVWDTALYILIAYETCWLHVNLQKAVLPKLMSVLRKGCDGNAKAIGPYLLPLLSKIPVDVYPTAGKFHADFFSNLRQGIALEKVQRSTGELGALVSAYVECLRFLLIDASAESKKSTDVAEDLILNNLMPVIESSIMEESSRLSLTPLFHLLSDLLARLRRAGHSSAYYQGLEGCFWGAFGRLCTSCVEDATHSSALLRVRAAFAALARKESNKKAPKKKAEARKVRFEDASRKDDSESESEESGPEAAQEPDARLSECAFSLCAAALRKYDLEESHAHLRFLADMIAMFACRQLCAALLAAASADPAGSAYDDVVLRLYDRAVLRWLRAPRRPEDVPLLVRVAFDVVGLVEEGRSKLEALDELCRVDGAAALAAAVRRFLAAGARADPATRAWLRGRAFSDAALRCARRLLEPDEDDRDTWDFVELCLPVVAEECVDRVLDVICDVIGQETSLDLACGLAARFFGTGPGCWTYPATDRLLAGVLRLSWEVAAGRSNFSAATLEACWRAGIASLISAQRMSALCLQDTCMLAQREALRHEDPMANLDAVTDFMSLFFDAVGRSAVTEPTLKLLGIVLPTIGEWEQMHAGMCRDAHAALAVGGELLFIEVDDNQDAIDCRRTLARSLFAARLLAGWANRAADAARFLLPHQLGVLVTASYCALVGGSSRRHETVAGRGWSHWGDELWQRSAGLLAAAGRGRLLLDECLSRARRRGFLHALTLRRLVAFFGAEVGADALLAELDSVPCAHVLQALVPAMDRRRRADLLARLLAQSAYGNPNWLAVVTACLAGEGPAEKARRPEDLEVIEVKEDGEDQQSEPERADSEAKFDPESTEPAEAEVAASPGTSRCGEAETTESVAGFERENGACESGASVDPTKDGEEEPIEVAGESKHVPDKGTEVESGMSPASAESVESTSKGQEESDALEPTSEQSRLRETSDEALATERPAETPSKAKDSVDLEARTTALAKEVVRGLLRHKADNPDALVFGRQLPEHWPTVTLNVQQAALLAALVAGHRPALEAEHWDFVLCSLGAWLRSLHESRACRGTPQFGALSRAVYRLADAAADCVGRGQVAADLATEWSEFYAARFYALLLDLFDAACDDRDPAAEPAVAALAAALRWIPAEAAVNNQLPPRLDARWGERDARLPVGACTALNRFAPLLASPSHDVQRGAFAVLRSLVGALPGCGAEAPQPDGEAAADLVPGALGAALAEGADFVGAMLAGTELGEACAAAALRPAETRGYLLAACLVLRLFARLSPEARYAQAVHLRDSGAVDALLKNLFRLMPENPAMDATKKGGAGKPAPISIFAALPDADSVDVASLDLAQLSCLVYLEALRRLPALVREWWNGLERRGAALVGRFTARHASPLLCAEDISAVQGAQRRFENMTIRTRPSTREVIANYDVEEIKFELVVRLPENHPLGPVVIETGRRIGVSSQQWRVWLLQLTTFLMHQNGSILDGLVLWKRNIDKKFEGVEECYVCYYVLHSSTCQLPSKWCRTCKKKFHSSCLYKWFTTSGHSTCPMCRSIW